MRQTDTDVNPEQNWFGTTQTDASTKTKLVHGVFSSVANSYDVMNDLMSFGLHRIWKDRFVTRLFPKAGEHILDLAGGTGDIATRILRSTRGKARVTVCDLTEDMVRQGRDRQINAGFVNAPDWVVGSAEILPFADASFDAVTIAFGLRNVSRIDTALTEIKRVLRPNGRFYCLEFSPQQTPLLEKPYALFSDHIIPRMGQLVANDRDSYQYLIESIRKFPKPKDLESRMQKAGFQKTGFTTFTYGICAVHCGFA